MRILNQTKDIDVEYCNYTVRQSTNVIIAISAFDRAVSYHMGQYNSDERAKEVMKELREIYMGTRSPSNRFYYEMPEE